MIRKKERLEGKRSWHKHRKRIFKDKQKDVGRQHENMNLYELNYLSRQEMWEKNEENG